MTWVCLLWKISHGPLNQAELVGNSDPTLLFRKSSTKASSCLISIWMQSWWPMTLAWSYNKSSLYSALQLPFNFYWSEHSPIRHRLSEVHLETWVSLHSQILWLYRRVGRKVELHSNQRDPYLFFLFWDMLFFILQWTWENTSVEEHSGFLTENVKVDCTEDFSSTWFQRCSAGVCASKHSAVCRVCPYKHWKLSSLLRHKWTKLPWLHVFHVVQGSWSDDNFLWRKWFLSVWIHKPWTTRKAIGQVWEVCKMM